MLTVKSLKRLLWVLRISVGGAAVLSVAINILHANLTGNTVSVFLSIWPPIAVVFSAEVISKIPIDPKRKWYRKLPRPLAMVLIALAGAFLSFMAQKGAIIHYTGDKAQSVMLPLIVDGFMIIMSMSAYEVNERLYAMAVAQRSREQRSEEEPVVRPQRRRNGEFSRREQVALLLDRDPNMSAAKIAEAVGCSAGYAATLKSELKKANGAELVGENALVS